MEDLLPGNPPFKKVKQEREEPEVRMDILPELLSEVKQESEVKTSLFYSKRPIDFVADKNRLVTDKFAKNFISTRRFDSFFTDFHKTGLGDFLKHLRLCDLHLTEKNHKAFDCILNSFSQLEKLDLFGFSCTASNPKKPKKSFTLSLPMLKSIKIESLKLINTLTLDAPVLQKLSIIKCPRLNLKIVKVESVERLVSESLEHFDVKQFKNLKNLKFLNYPSEDYLSELLSSLDQLDEIHLNDPESAAQLLEQKEQYGREHLKIFLCGLLLKGKDDPALKLTFGIFDDKIFTHLVENQSRLADKIPFFNHLQYSAIEGAPERVRNVLSRFTDLNGILIDSAVQDNRRFLNFLESFKIAELVFAKWNPPQNLLNDLPDHCADLQSLIIWAPVSEFNFLTQLPSLIYLKIDCLVDAGSIRAVLERLEFLLTFEFKFANKKIVISIDPPEENTNPNDTVSRLTARERKCS